MTIFLTEAGRVIIASIRDLGSCPCPRCLIPLSHVPNMGKAQDMKLRKSLIRVDDERRRYKVELARGHPNPDRTPILTSLPVTSQHQKKRGRNQNRLHTAISMKTFHSPSKSTSPRIPNLIARTSRKSSSYSDYAPKEYPCSGQNFTPPMHSGRRRKEISSNSQDVGAQTRTTS